jgi:hypothetical protein
MRVKSTRMRVEVTLMCVKSTRRCVKSTRKVLFSNTRRRVKSTRTAAHVSYRAACQIDTQIFSVHLFLTFILIVAAMFCILRGSLKVILFLDQYSIFLFLSV